MKSISLEKLKECARFLRDHLSEGRCDSDFITFGMASEFLRAVVGNEWTNQMIFSLHPNVSRPNRPGRDFMKAEEEATENRYRNQERTRRIAELIFNLQSVEGIDGLLDDFRVGKVESTYAELEVGGFLHRRSIPFKYVNETGVKGLDYDADIFLPSGNRVNCEMKCKIESTELSKVTIRNALGAARKQLPSRKPGIVFLKIPELWLHDPSISTLLPAAIDDFLRETSRVVAVVLRWEELYLEVKENGALVAYKYRVECGKPTKNIHPEIRSLLDQLSALPSAAWTSFRTIAEEAVQKAL